MASGHAAKLTELPNTVAGIIDEARRGSLATIGGGGRPHVVPVCFAVVGTRILSAVDQKPKSRKQLGRVRNVIASPTATITFDRWDEDWAKLAWVMVRGAATIEPPGTGSDALIARYPQYRDDPPAGEVIAVEPDEIVWWTWA
jgi:PPOX class probable F420-dependent enzyme